MTPVPVPPAPDGPPQPARALRNRHTEHDMTDEFKVSSSTYGFHDNVSSEDSHAFHELIENLRKAMESCIRLGDENGAARLYERMNMLLRIADAKSAALTR
jgi:hypothetical protein